MITRRQFYNNHNSQNYQNMLKSIVVAEPGCIHQYETSKRQLNRLKSLLNDYPNIATMTMRDWHSYHLDNESLNCFFGNEKVYNNQSQRAKLVINEALKNGCHKIVYLDGHGRMTYCMIEQIKEIEKRLRIQLNLTLINVEYDPNMHDWHCLLYPKDIIKIHDDVISYLDNLTNIEKESMMVYLNFCGLNGQYQDLIELIADLRRFNPVMLSYSNRSGSHLYMDEFEHVITSFMNGKLVNYKHNFPTYLIPIDDIFIDLSF